MADVRELAQQIQRSRDIALKFAGQSSDKHLIKLLVKAHNDLNQQIGEHARMGRSEQFTAVHAQAVMAQLKSVMMPLTRGLSSLVVDTTSKVAKASAQQAINYVKMAEDTFHGIGAASALQLHEAMIVDRVANGVRASQMRRLATSGEAGSDLQGVALGKAGIIQRYGMNVVGKFEEVLQQRYLTRKPWGEVRDELVAQSPFLTGKEPGVATTWAERILRTETMYASNAANKECMVDMNQSLGDMVNILCATFDERTGSDSYAVHGQIRRLNEPFQSWFGSYMHPPNRPNDREIVVAHRMSWPLPPTFTPKTEGEVASRWKAEGRKGAPPSRPNMSTIPRDQFGKRAE